jgi:Nucleotidyl transferase AbiEii toxin, Type IV TA system
MPSKLYWNTITPLLKRMLCQLMEIELFQPFRLVGGTSLSLQLGHRSSIDIDLFTDRPYDSIDFKALDDFLRNAYPYVSNPTRGPVGMGRSYLIGDSEMESVKLDLYYTDTFIQPELVIEGIRMASIEEVIAMKIDIVQRGGRKKDFWDLHELMDQYPPARMISLHELRYPYGHDETLIRSNFIYFSMADDDFDPVCLKGKYWEIIKLDITQALR